MKVPKPFDPQPQRPSETQQQAQVQSKEPETPPEAPQSVPENPATPEEARADPPATPEEGQSAPDQEEAAEPQPAPPATTAQGLFASLAQLLGDSTLLMTVAKTGEERNEPTLTVTVVPQAETESFTPVCLTGSVTELDTHFIPALESKAESRKSLELGFVTGTVPDSFAEPLPDDELDAWS